MERSDRRWWEFWKPRYEDRLSHHAVIVLSDLRKFCGVGGSKFHPDQRTTDRMIGRDDVWMRIQSYLNLTEDQVYKLVEQLEADYE